MPSVRFVHMWEGFNPHRNPLLTILRAAVPVAWKVVTSEREKVDLEVGSVYPTKIDLARGMTASAFRRGLLRSPIDIRETFSTPGKSETARVGIWYTAENRRPPSDGWDLTLSYEAGDWPGNAYLPFWQIYSDLFGGDDAGLLGEPLRTEELHRFRSSSTSQRPGFCCAILRNPDPVRLRVVKELSRLGSVDIYGPLARRPVPAKATVLRRYRFALVFENDLYPGYVTEKPFDAWQCQAVPIYWGLDSAGNLNPDALLNMAGMSGPLELVEQVAYMDKNRELIDAMVAQPILTSLPDPDAVLRLVRSLVMT